MRGDLGEDQMLGVCRDLMPVLEGVVGDEKVGTTVIGWLGVLPDSVRGRSNLD